MAIFLCQLSELRDGYSRGFDPLGEGRDTMFVIRTRRQLIGYRNICPHLSGARMAWKKDEYLSGDRKHVMCSAHGALFTIGEGLCVAGPCLGEYLTRLELEVRNGEVWLLKPYDRNHGTGSASAKNR